MKLNIKLREMYLKKSWSSQINSQGGIVILKSNVPLRYYAFFIDIHLVDSCALAEH
jgi:hypothetical protein